MFIGLLHFTLYQSQCIVLGEEEECIIRCVALLEVFTASIQVSALTRLSYPLARRLLQVVGWVAMLCIPACKYIQSAYPTSHVYTTAIKDGTWAASNVAELGSRLNRAAQ